MFILAGVAGLEPAPTVLETGMLAIDTIPLSKNYCIINAVNCNMNYSLSLKIALTGIFGFCVLLRFKYFTKDLWKNKK